MLLTCLEKSKDLAIPDSYGNHMSEAESKSKKEMGQVCVSGDILLSRRFRAFTGFTKGSMTQKEVKSLRMAPLPFPTFYLPLSVLPSALPTSVVWSRSKFHSFNLFLVTLSSP